jgi:hypothetical protein
MNRRSLCLLISAAVLSVATLATSADERAARARSQPFPYDPACAWGRLSDGKGFRIRCLTRDEACTLLSGVGAVTL